jgi:hypothetical protein
MAGAGREPDCVPLIVEGVCARGARDGMSIINTVFGRTAVDSRWSKIGTRTSRTQTLSGGFDRRDLPVMTRPLRTVPVSFSGAMRLRAV